MNWQAVSPPASSFTGLGSGANGSAGGEVRMGSERALRWSIISSETLVAILYSQARSEACTWSESSRRQARNMASCRASSASSSEPKKR